jgi:hypothetical protein
VRVAACRRQSGHRQSLLSGGIGRRKLSSAHQQEEADRPQANSAPQPAQTRRRETWLVSFAASAKFKAFPVPIESEPGFDFLA